MPKKPIVAAIRNVGWATRRCMENKSTMAACVTEIVRLIAVFSQPREIKALPTVSSNSANNMHQEIRYVLVGARENCFMIAPQDKAGDRRISK